MSDAPAILEYATTAELWDELARRSRIAVLIHIPNMVPRQEYPIQHRYKGDPLIIYDLISRYAQTPLRIRSSNYRAGKLHPDDPAHYDEPRSA